MPNVIITYKIKKKLIHQEEQKSLSKLFYQTLAKNT